MNNDVYASSFCWFWWIKRLLRIFIAIVCRMLISVHKSTFYRLSSRQFWLQITTNFLTCVIQPWGMKIWGPEVDFVSLLNWQSDKLLHFTWREPEELIREAIIMSAGYCGIPMPAPSVPTPRGLEAIYSTLRQIYPDQPNPLQVTALVKYWWVHIVFIWLDQLSRNLGSWKIVCLVSEIPFHDVWSVN